MKYLWLDDESPNGPKQKASDELKRIKGINKRSVFLNVKGKNIWELLNAVVFPHIHEYDLILIDHVFGGTTDANLTGSTVAESIRDRQKNCPIIAVTNVPGKIDIHKHGAYDDVIKFADDMSQRVDYLKSVSDGFRLLNKKPPSNVDDLMKLLKAPRDDHERLIKIIPHELKSSMADPGFVSSFYKWIKFKFLERPGFVLNRIWTSTVLGVKESRFDIVEGLFEKARYKGIFSKVSDQRWWQSQIKKVLFDTLSDEPEMLPWELGHKLPGLSAADVPICPVCKEKFPEIVAFTDETAKTARPMHIKCTELHRDYESSLYFEDIRLMRR